MQKDTNLKKAGAFYLVGTLFNKGIGFITIPIFTRILTVQDYGIVTTYNSWVSILSMVLSLALYMAVRASFIDYKDKTENFLAVILTFTIAYGCCISGIILVVVYIVPMTIECGVVALCLLQSVAGALIENVSMFFMMNYRYKARTAIMVLPNLISTLIAIVVIKYLMSDSLYLGRIIPSAVVTLIFGIGVTGYIFLRTGIRFDKEYLSYGLKISTPLVLHGIALNILSQSDRSMITAIRNASETGIYGLIYNFSMIATVLTTALDGIWVPFFTEEMNSKEYGKINSFASKYIKLMTIVIVSVMLVAPEVVKILATQPYWAGISIIPPIVLSNFIIFLYTLYVNIEHYHKKTVFISLNTLIAASTNIVLNLFFIKYFGYIGAAYTTVASYLISFFLHYIYARKLNAILFPLTQVVFPMVLITVMTVLFYFFIDVWIIRWTVVFAMIIVALFTEKEWILNSLIGEKRHG